MILGVIFKMSSGFRGLVLGDFTKTGPLHSSQRRNKLAADQRGQKQAFISEERSSGKKLLTHTDAGILRSIIE